MITTEAIFSENPLIETNWLAISAWCDIKIKMSSAISSNGWTNDGSTSFLLNTKWRSNRFMELDVGRSEKEHEVRCDQSWPCYINCKGDNWNSFKGRFHTFSLRGRIYINHLRYYKLAIINLYLGITERVVQSPEETLELMESGNKSRATGSTAMNQTSSRSHAIFTITLEAKNVNDP